MVLAPPDALLIEPAASPIRTATTADLAQSLLRRDKELGACRVQVATIRKWKQDSLAEPLEQEG